MSSCVIIQFKFACFSRKTATKHKSNLRTHLILLKRNLTRCAKCLRFLPPSQSAVKWKENSTWYGGTATMQNENRLKIYSLFNFFSNKKSFSNFRRLTECCFRKKIRQKQLLKPFPISSAAEKHRVENCLILFETKVLLCSLYFSNFHFEWILL